MGDRANIYIHEGDCPGVYIYTHWYGSDLPAMVSKILDTPRAKNRANDCSYLTRIIIEDLLVSTDSLGEENGWGVSGEVGDGADRIVDINASYRHGLVVTYIGYDEYDDDYTDIYDEYDEVLIQSNN